MQISTISISIYKRGLLDHLTETNRPSSSSFIESDPATGWTRSNHGILSLSLPCNIYLFMNRILFSRIRRRAPDPRSIQRDIGNKKTYRLTRHSWIILAILVHANWRINISTRSPDDVRIPTETLNCWRTEKKKSNNKTRWLLQHSVPRNLLKSTNYLKHAHIFFDNL